MAFAESAAEYEDNAESAAEYKDHVEGLILALQAEATGMVGRERHKERAARGKRIAELRGEPCYVDACRVFKGLEPVHGFFIDDGPQGSPLGPCISEAAELAAAAEEALAEITEPQEPEHVAPAPGSAEEEAAAIREWSERLARLESKMAEPLEQQHKSEADIAELEALAQEIVDYRRSLKDVCGYRNRDLRADGPLQALEERLDVVAAALLPAEAEGPALIPVDELRDWERRLTTRLAHHNHLTMGLSPSHAKEVGRLVSEVAELKAKLRAAGFTEHEQDRDAEVLRRLVRIAELRQFERHGKKHGKAGKGELKEIRGELEQLQEQIAGHKRRLRDEQRYHHREVKHDPEVCELEERMAVLLRMGA